MPGKTSYLTTLLESRLFLILWTVLLTAGLIHFTQVAGGAKVLLVPYPVTERALRWLYYEFTLGAFIKSLEGSKRKPQSAQSRPLIGTLACGVGIGWVFTLHVQMVLRQVDPSEEMTDLHLTPWHAGVAILPAIWLAHQAGNWFFGNYRNHQERRKLSQRSL